jgi:hypothetical protein
MGLLALLAGGRAAARPIPGGIHAPAVLGVLDGGAATLRYQGRPHPMSISLPRRSAAPARPGAPRHTVTITGTNLAGQPDTGDFVGLDNVDAPGTPGTGIRIFDHGTARFSVPAGTYWAVGMFAQFSRRGRIIAARMDVLARFTVSGSTTVHTRAAAATSKVNMITTRPAVSVTSTLTVVRGAPHRPAGGPSSMGLTALNVPLWVSPVSRPPGHGTLLAYTSGQLISPPGRGCPMPTR